MAASSLSVVANANRLRRFTPPPIASTPQLSNSAFPTPTSSAATKESPDGRARFPQSAERTDDASEAMR